MSLEQDELLREIAAELGALEHALQTTRASAAQQQAELQVGQFLVKRMTLRQPVTQQPTTPTKWAVAELRAMHCRC